MEKWNGKVGPLSNLDQNQFFDQFKGSIIKGAVFAACVLVLAINVLSSPSVPQKAQKAVVVVAQPQRPPEQPHLADCFANNFCLQYLQRRLDIAKEYEPSWK